jgi:hypothetical protein
MDSLTLKVAREKNSIRIRLELSVALVTYFRGSNARRQWPGGTLCTVVVLESMSQSVGECTNTGDDERL